MDIQETLREVVGVDSSDFRNKARKCNVTEGSETNIQKVLRALDAASLRSVGRMIHETVFHSRIGFQAGLTCI